MSPPSSPLKRRRSPSPDSHHVASTTRFRTHPRLHTQHISFHPYSSFPEAIVEELALATQNKKAFGSMRAIELEGQMEQPYQPSEEEQSRFYYGLHSRPKLVARSSTYRWQDTSRFDPWPIKKTLLPAVDHPIIRIWNDGSSSLRQALIRSLQYVHWTAVDFLRVGYDADLKEYGLQDSEYHEHYLVMLVSVLPTTTTWDTGVHAVLACREALKEHGFKDIHCEMKESIVMRTTEQIETQGYMKLLGTANTAAPDMQRSDFLGSSIASVSKPNKLGTKGLYLHLKDDSGSAQVVALTCRHVMDDLGDHVLESQIPDENDDSVQIIQPCNSTFDNNLMKAKRAKHYAETRLRKAQKEAKKTKGFEACEDAELYLKTAKHAIGQLEKLSEVESRVFGRLFYKAGMRCGTTAGAAQWIPDWALISLYQDRHHTALGDLQNRVHLSEDETIRRHDFHRMMSGLSLDPSSYMDDSGCTLRLEGAISEAELTEKSSQKLLVGKVGAKSGTTFGISNAIKSVTRSPYTSLPVLTDRVCEEWCILGIEDDDGQPIPFTRRGDSGACVWTMDGRVAGIISAGHCSEENDSIDVTYAMVWERLEADIIAHGFHVVLP